MRRWCVCGGGVFGTRRATRVRDSLLIRTRRARAPLTRVRSIPWVGAGKRRDLERHGRKATGDAG